MTGVAFSVGTEVPGGQLCDDEQGRQVLSDDWPERRVSQEGVKTACANAMVVVTWCITGVHLLQMKMCRRGKEYPVRMWGRNGRKDTAALASAQPGHKGSPAGRGWALWLKQGSNC